MCLSELDEKAYKLAELLIARGWDRTAAYGYAAAWMRRKYYSSRAAKRLPEDTRYFLTSRISDPDGAVVNGLAVDGPGEEVDRLARWAPHRDRCSGSDRRVGLDIAHDGHESGRDRVVNGACEPLLREERRGVDSREGHDQELVDSGSRA